MSFMTERGRFLARVNGPVRGNVLLRRQQYRQADDPAVTAGLARSFLIGKIANSRTVLQRAARCQQEGSDTACMEIAVKRLGSLLESLREECDVEILRGLEGVAANTYFDVFDQLITAQKDSFCFRERTRRPPLDRMNALLSFLYTLLAHDAESALETNGLDPQVGYLHRDRPGRPGLALDLMEEFRAFLADRVALSLVNLRQVNASGFEVSETGAVSMDDETRKTVLVAYQKRKQDDIAHPFLGETIKVGLLPHVQSLLLARYIRGDLDAYPPFTWK